MLCVPGFPLVCSEQSDCLIHLSVSGRETLIYHRPTRTDTDVFGKTCGQVLKHRGWFAIVAIWLGNSIKGGKRTFLVNYQVLHRFSGGGGEVFHLSRSLRKRTGLLALQALGSHDAPVSISRLVRPACREALDRQLLCTDIYASKANPFAAHGIGEIMGQTYTVMAICLRMWQDPIRLCGSYAQRRRLRHVSNPSSGSLPQPAFNRKLFWDQKASC